MSEVHPEPEKVGSEEKARSVETEEERAERIAKQEEIDRRSVYVGNVDYQSTPEQLESFFKAVGVIERITILFDKFLGLPKGYAYVEFESPESVQRAINELHGSMFRGRDLRVTPKRTNLPGFKKKSGFKPRGRGGFRGRGSFRGRGFAKSGARGDSKPSEQASAPESASFFDDISSGENQEA